MQNARFRLEENTDKTSPQSSVIKFEDADGTTSGLVVGVVTELGATYSLVPSANETWLKVLDADNEYLHGFVVQGSRQTGDLKVGPIASVITESGEKVYTLLSFMDNVPSEGLGAFNLPPEQLRTFLRGVAGNSVDGDPDPVRSQIVLMGLKRTEIKPRTNMLQ